MGNIQFQYPFAFILLVILSGLTFAILLYFRDNQFKEKAVWLRALLFALRSIAVSLIAFFLLLPYFKQVKEELKKPVLLIAQDVSQSIAEVHHQDSINHYLEQLNEISEDLEDKFDVQRIHFGAESAEGLLDSNTHQASDFSSLFQYVDNRFYGVPTAGMILLTDGIFNLGTNPIYVEKRNTYPVFPIALGDTISRPDIIIKNIYHNDIAFLGDSIPIEYDISGKGFSGSAIQVRISEKTNKTIKEINSKRLVLRSGEEFLTSSFNVHANNIGTRQYILEVFPLKNEWTTSNNRKDIFIDVIDSRIQISIISRAAHPDITALKYILGQNKNFEVKHFQGSEYNKISDEDVIIFHDLPTPGIRLGSIMQKIELKKIPHLFIAGEKCNLNLLSTIQDIVKISSSLRSYNEVIPLLNGNFNSFELDDETVNKLRSFPPLSVAYANYDEGPNSKSLLSQKIGNVDTDYPLFSFSDINGLKSGILLGEGLWKWRLNSYARHGNIDALSELINKSIKYLSIKEDKRKWRVSMDKRIWNEQEKIRFYANFFNDNYEAINDPEARMTLTNQNGENFDFLFSRKNDYYILDAGYLPAGNYSYLASLETGSQTKSTRGSFIVKSLQIELSDLQARHDILFQLAGSTGGNMFYSSQIKELEKSLIDQEVKPVIFNTETYLNLLNIKWIFFLILGLLSLEWFLRRYFGNY